MINMVLQGTVLQGTVFKHGVTRYGVTRCCDRHDGRLVSWSQSTSYSAVEK